MKKSKYLGMVNGDWECTHVGVARVQPAYTHFRDKDDKKVRSKYPGHQVYFYVFERLTSDKKAIKSIQLNSAQALQVLKGQQTVEYFAERAEKKKEKKRSLAVTKRVNYSFCD